MNIRKEEAPSVFETSMDRVEVTFYTDPFCCWSWALEPQWRRLRYEYAGKIVWRYCMGGLIGDIHSFNDPMNAVSRPSQMGPLWMEVKHLSGMPVSDHIWMTEPPVSSYPSCIAVKCAALQSPVAAEQLLRKLREAIMLKGLNISREDVLLQSAEELSVQTQSFDFTKFKEDYYQGAGLEAFKNDLQYIRYQKISRFPTLTFERDGKEGIIIVGYRPYKVLLDAFRAIASDIEPTQKVNDETSYRNFWGGNVLNRELEELKI
ncbi:MAG TPA: DsbA family protein [Cytophagaceae bacterium]